MAFKEYLLDDDVVVNKRAGDLGDAVGAAGVGGGGHDGGGAEGAQRIDNAMIVGGDEHLAHTAALKCLIDHMLDEGFAGG